MTIAATTLNGTHAVQLPSGWKLMKLRFLLEVNPTTPVELRAQGDRLVPFIPMEALGEDGSLDTTRERPVTELLTGYSYFANDDVLMAKVTPCFENGKAALVEALPGGHGFGSTEVTTLRASNGLNPDFLYYLVRSDHFRQASIASMTGAGGLKRVSDEHIRSFETLVPSEIEQRSIARFLNRETAKIDALIAKQEQLIATLREERQSVVSQVLSGYRSIPLHRLVDPSRPMSYGILQCGEHVEAGVPYIGPSDMPGWGESPSLEMLRRTSPEIAAQYRRSVLQGGDIVVSIGPAYGKVALLENDLTGSNLTQDTVRIAPVRSSVEPAFLVWALGSPEAASFWDAEIAGATFRRLNLGTLGQTPIPLPELSTQRDISAALDSNTSKIDALIAKSTEMIETLREYRSALITHAVTGKIDVREAV